MTLTRMICLFLGALVIMLAVVILRRDNPPAPWDFPARSAG